MHSHIQKELPDEQFHEVVDRLRAKIPNLAIGTDIIVGFSGESPEQFQKTIDMYRDIKFDIGYNARYSERSGTAAKRAFKDDVTQEEKKRRWNELQAVMEDVVRKKNQQYVGEIVSVLVERHEAPKITDEMLKMPEKIQETLKKQPGMCFGNSREMKLVTFVGGKELVGEIVISESDPVAGSARGTETVETLLSHPPRPRKKSRR